MFFFLLQMTIMMSELASQDDLSAHPVTLLATSNGTQIAVQVGIILLSIFVFILIYFQALIIVISVYWTWVFGSLVAEWADVIGGGSEDSFIFTGSRNDRARWLNYLQDSVFKKTSDQMISFCICPLASVALRLNMLCEMISYRFSSHWYRYLKGWNLFVF